MTPRDPIDLLHEHGLKATPQRVAILRHLRSDDGHPTAEEIHRDLTHEHPTISLSTVYTTLERLTQSDLAAAIPCWDGTLRYDARTTPHLNLVCQTCAAIQNAENPRLQTVLDRIDEETMRTIPRGPITIPTLCQGCQRGQDP